MRSAPKTAGHSAFLSPAQGKYKKAAMPHLGEGTGGNFRSLFQIVHGVRE
jgi:hypothetical protein